jgi:NAD(P)-dependent dehydrogenase (short-subunit alcohol dehydrogenase family)
MRCAIVTGAGTGIGAAVAQRLHRDGHGVVLTGRRSEPLEEVARELEEALVVEADTGEAADAERTVTAAVERFGGVDVLVNNAGVGTAYPATREDPDEFRKVIDINLNGCYWMAQACGRVMQPGSSIVNISSVLGLTTAGLPQAAYSASKAALIGLTRDLAQQWTGRKGIRVNALAPGFFESEMTAQYPDGYLEGMQQYRMLVQRKGDPEELAAALIFLASDAGGYVTGVTLAVDGGVSST